jgi:mono/diheme cytochrome c family protein
VVPSVASNTIGSASQGQLIFVAYCQQCHGPEGKKGIENPGSVDGEIPVVNPIDPEISGANKNGKIPDVQTFVNNLDVYLQDGSSPDATPDGGTVKYKMPSFGNTYAMSQQQIANVEAYVVQINGGNVATINKPGVEPKLYAWWAVAGFVLVAVFGGLALVMGRRRKQT